MSDERTDVDPERAQRIADTQQVLTEHGMPEPNQAHVAHLRAEIARKRAHLATPAGIGEEAAQLQYMRQWAAQHGRHTAA